MRTQKTISLCIVLLLLATCILTACFTPSKCNNLCSTCGKCQDEACEICTEKCTCHKCESVCPVCNKCLDSECTEDVCQNKCTCHACANKCPTCNKCTNADCTEAACANKCTCHVCQNKCLYCNKCTNADCTEDECQAKCECAPLQITCESYTMTSASGSSYSTPYYIYKTNKVGPKIVIVGGIHGDETAGWKQAEALKVLLDKARLGKVDPMLEGIRGTILLMPKANIKGCNYLTRAIESSGDKYNLNRAFPTNRYSSATAVAKNLADAVCKVVDDFMATPNSGYDGPNVIIDLHESRGSWKKPVNNAALGYTLIHNNDPWVTINGELTIFMEELLNRYNNVYRPDGETNFKSEPAVVGGSFSQHFSTTYPDDVVFTIETDRQYVGGTNTVAESIRLRQQKDVLTAMFDLVWNRV